MRIRVEGILHLFFLSKVSAVTNHTLKGKKIDPKPAEPRPGEEAILKIFVGGIDTNMSDEELKSYFEKFGHVRSFSPLSYNTCVYRLVSF